MKLSIILLVFSLPLCAETLYITGSVESDNTQSVLMPLVPTFNGKISEMAEEGIKVKKGDFLLKIDGSSIHSQIDAQIEQLEVFKATSKKEKIDLKIQLNTAEISFLRAETDLKIAKKEAEIPLDFIGELAYKQNQLRLKNSEKTFEKTKNDLDEVKTKIANKESEVEIGLNQKQKKLDYLQDTLDKFTIYSEQAGYVIYSTRGWSGEKIQIGDQLNSGQEVLRVSQNDGVHIVAWLNAIDLPKINKNNTVNIRFDSFLDKKYSGQVTGIASGGEDKQIWGDALYYKAIIEITGKQPDNLMLGMSALVEVNVESGL